MAADVVAHAVPPDDWKISAFRSSPAGLAPRGSMAAGASMRLRGGTGSLPTSSMQAWMRASEILGALVATWSGRTPYLSPRVATSEAKQAPPVDFCGSAGPLNYPATPLPPVN